MRDWINCYGRLYRAWLGRSLARIDDVLVRWARSEYKRLDKHRLLMFTTQHSGACSDEKW